MGHFGGVQAVVGPIASGDWHWTDLAGCFNLLADSSS